MLRGTNRVKTLWYKTETFLFLCVFGAYTYTNIKYLSLISHYLLSFLKPNSVSSLETIDIKHVQEASTSMNSEKMPQIIFQMCFIAVLLLLFEDSHCDMFTCTSCFGFSSKFGTLLL